MRTIILLSLTMFFSALKAQTFSPSSFADNNYNRNFEKNVFRNDSSFKKKWTFTRYSAVSTNFSFFKGGSATIISAPIGLQLNSRLNNNFYAFAGLSFAPAYINFNQRFINSDFNKTNHNNTFLRSCRLGIYSRAELGLQYINDEKTFSISGSIGIERSSYSILPYYQMNNTKMNQISTNR